MFNKKKKNNKGFTLVELLVVIAIIGILAVVAVPSLFKQMDKAKATQVVANVKAIQTEIMTEYASSNDDAGTVANVNTYITAQEFGTAEKNKLKESYVVKAGTDSDTIDIQITFQTDDTAIASNVAGQLGASLHDTNKYVVIYTVKK